MIFRIAWAVSSIMALERWGVYDRREQPVRESTEGVYFITTDNVWKQRCLEKQEENTRLQKELNTFIKPKAEKVESMKSKLTVMV